MFVIKSWGSKPSHRNISNSKIINRVIKFLMTTNLLPHWHQNPKWNIHTGIVHKIEFDSFKLSKGKVSNMRNAGLFTSQRHVANNYSKNALFLLSQKGKLKTKISNSHIFLTTIIRVSDSGETPNVSPPQILVLSINYETNPQFGTWSPLKLFTPPPPPQEFFLHSTKLVY